MDGLKKLEPYEAKTVLLLRSKDHRFNGYLDDEIVDTYRLYSGVFYAAGWQEVDPDEFISWAFAAPIDQSRSKSKG